MPLTTLERSIPLPHWIIESDLIGSTRIPPVTCETPRSDHVRRGSVPMLPPSEDGTAAHEMDGLLTVQRPRGLLQLHHLRGLSFYPQYVATSKRARLHQQTQSRRCEWSTFIVRLGIFSAAEVDQDTSGRRAMPHVIWNDHPYVPAL